MKTRFFLLFVLSLIVSAAFAQKADRYKYRGIFDAGDSDEDRVFEYYAKYMKEKTGIEVACPTLFHDLSVEGKRLGNRDVHLGEFPPLFFAGPVLESKYHDCLLVLLNANVTTYFYYNRSAKGVLNDYFFPPMSSGCLDGYHRGSGETLEGKPATPADVRVILPPRTPFRTDTVYVLELQNSFEADSVLRKNFDGETRFDRKAPLKYPYVTKVAVVREGTPTLVFKLFMTKEAKKTHNGVTYYYNVLAALDYPEEPQKLDLDYVKVYAKQREKILENNHSGKDIRIRGDKGQSASERLDALITEINHYEGMDMRHSDLSQASELQKEKFVSVLEEVRNGLQEGGHEDAATAFVYKGGVMQQASTFCKQKEGEATVFGTNLKFNVSAMGILFLPSQVEGVCTISPADHRNEGIRFVAQETRLTYNGSRVSYVIVGHFVRSNEKSRTFTITGWFDLKTNRDKMNIK